MLIFLQDINIFVILFKQVDETWNKDKARIVFCFQTERRKTGGMCGPQRVGYTVRSCGLISPWLFCQFIRIYTRDSGDHAVFLYSLLLPVFSALTLVIGGGPTGRDYYFLRFLKKFSGNLYNT